MLINKENELTINELYFHDAVLCDFKFDREGKSVVLTIRQWNEKSPVELNFSNVIAFDMTLADFWGPSKHINGCFLNDEEKRILIPTIKKRWEKESYDENFPYKDFIEIGFEFISGDYLIIAFESLSISAC